MFSFEDNMRDILIDWLEKNGLKTKKSVYVRTFEIDIAAIGKKQLDKNGNFDPTPQLAVYAFETKIATSKKLMNEVLEQAILRLVAADYVYIVVPDECETWVNNREKEKIKPHEILRRWLYGTYSRKLGLIALSPDGKIKVVKQAHKSGLTIPELKDIVKKQLMANHAVFKF